MDFSGDTGIQSIQLAGKDFYATIAEPETKAVDAHSLVFGHL